MLTRIAALAAVLTAPLTFAQQYHPAVPVGAPMPAVIQVNVGRPPPASRPGGRWELQASQQWVPGATQQVWVAGSCVGHPRKPWLQRCSPGQYVTQQSPGRYETVQQWVWVDFGGRRDRYDRFDRNDRRHGRFGGR